MYVYEYIYMHKDAETPGTRVTGGFELPNMGIGNQILVFYQV